MMKKKDVIVTVLATFCLAVTLFCLMPVRSAQPYNPWADYNDDGKINMVDIANVASQFATSGDPTKNVNITNWPETHSVQTGTVNITLGGPSIIPEIVCEGFSRLNLIVIPTASRLGLGYVTIGLSNVIWTSDTNGAYTIDPISSGVFNFTTGSENSPAPFYQTVTKAPLCYPQFSCLYVSPAVPTGFWVTFDYTVYLRNE